MKSIYQKITAILVGAFFIQLVSIVIFYNQVIQKSIVTEVKQQDDGRQAIITEITNHIDKSSGIIANLRPQLRKASLKYNASFEISLPDGTTVLSSYVPKPSFGVVEEHQNVIVDSKVKYIIYGIFPAKLNNLQVDKDEERLRLFGGIVILAISVISLILIYKIIADPLKKLSKAIDKVNYGSTLVEIPYYNNDELGMLCRRFEDMGKRLKKSEEDQQDIIQALSHDIKTPLTSIMGFSKRLAEGKVSGEKKEDYYEAIYRKSNDLKDLLYELDDYANINSEKKYKFEFVSSKEYLNCICHEIEKESEQKGYKFTYNINITGDSKIKIDIKKLKRIYSNIISNSLKYADDDCRIILKCLSKNDKLKIEITDNGPGVSKEQINKIFDKFYRIDTSRSREKGGTGLGLAICKEIIENHGGQIGAYNDINKGLCIWFTLPLY